MNRLRKRLALFTSFLILATCPPPVAADTGAPAFGCNKAGCSIYLLEYAWPDVVEINAFEFFRFKLDVNKQDTRMAASVKYAGVLCWIPKLKDSAVCSGKKSEPELPAKPAVELEAKTKRAEPDGRVWLVARCDKVKVEATTLPPCGSAVWTLASLEAGPPTR